MDRKEAIDSIKEIRKAISKIQSTKQAIESKVMGQILIIWGIVWCYGFFCTQLFLHLVFLIWTSAWLIGGIGTAIVVIKNRKHQKEHSKPGFTWHFSIYWLLLTCYCIIIWLIISPDNYDKIGVYIPLFVMMGYVLIGIWGSRILLFTGLGISAGTLIGWFLIPEYFGFWMAFMGGGGLAIPGICVLAKVKRKMKK